MVSDTLGLASTWKPVLSTGTHPGGGALGGALAPAPPGEWGAVFHLDKVLLLQSPDGIREGPFFLKENVSFSQVFHTTFSLRQASARQRSCHSAEKKSATTDWPSAWVGTGEDSQPG